MKTKTIHFCRRRLALLLAVVLSIYLLPGMAVAAKTAVPSKTISATIKFYNHTGKRITELYFEDSEVDDYGEEYLSFRNFRYWSNNRYIKVPLKFKRNASLDFFIRYNDGTGYEAQGLRLAKAKASGSVIDLTKSQVTLKVRNRKVASAKFVKREDEAPSVTGISLNKTAATLMAGQKVNLTASVSPSGADKKVTWTSSNTSIATVNSAGTVTGVKAGTATITAETVDGGYTASCLVTVTEKKVTSVTLNKTSLSLKAGNTAYLRATISPSGTNKKVTWNSSDPSVASVSSTGKVTGIKAGTATITAETVDGGYTASCLVTVTETRVTSVKLNKTSLSLKAGNTAHLYAAVSPSGTNKKVTWSSSDLSVATVSSTGKVTGIKAGTATITATTVDGGYTASCRVTVAAKTISASIYFYNNTGRQIDELYFEETGNSSWGEEYLASRNFRYWTAGKRILIPLKFTSDASLDFYIRCNDGSAYEARGLSLANAKTSGTKIELTASEVRLTVNGTTAATAAFVQKEAPTTPSTTLSDADWAALQNNYNALSKVYNAAADLYNSDQIKADKNIEALMKEAKSLIEQMGTIERDGLSTADGQKLNQAMKETAEALQKIIEAMEVVPKARTINVKFINGTTVDFTNFSAKPQGGTGSSPVTLKADHGETTLQFTVPDNVSAFEITFVESANNQPYTMTVTFDSSVNDDDTLTVLFNVNEATQEIVYSQI